MAALFNTIRIQRFVLKNLFDRASSNPTDTVDHFELARLKRLLAVDDYAALPVQDGDVSGPA